MHTTSRRGGLSLAAAFTREHHEIDAIEAYLAATSRAAAAPHRCEERWRRCAATSTSGEIVFPPLPGR